MMPNNLCWELSMYMPDMLKKAIAYLDNERSMLRQYSGQYFVLRFKAEASRLSKNTIKE